MTPYEKWYNSVFNSPMERVDDSILRSIIKRIGLSIVGAEIVDNFLVVTLSTGTVIECSGTRTTNFELFKNGTITIDSKHWKGPLIHISCGDQEREYTLMDIINWDSTIPGEWYETQHNFFGT